MRRLTTYQFEDSDGMKAVRYLETKHFRIEDGFGSEREAGYVIDLENGNSRCGFWSLYFGWITPFPDSRLLKVVEDFVGEEKPTVSHSPPC